MRSTLAIVRLLLSILPLLVIGFWAVGYVRSCWLSLLAPGVPVKLSLSTPGGPVTFTAASYSFQPRTGHLVLTFPSVHDPKGVLIASAQRLDVRGIDALDPTLSALTVHAYKVEGTLVRNADGRFEIQSLFPSSTKPTKEVPFDVTIDQANITVNDYFGGTLWTRKLVVENVSVAGLGQRWLAGANLTVAGSGSGWVSTSHQADGSVVVHGQADDFDLADIGHHVLATSNLGGSWRSLDAKRVVASGPVDIVLAPNVGPRIRFSGTAEADGLRAAGYAASTATFKGTVTELGASGLLAAKGPGLSATFDGGADWQRGQLSVSGQASAEVASLKVLPPPIAKLLPAGLGATNLSYRGSAGFEAKGGAFVNGRVTSSEANYKQDLIKGFSGPIRVSGTSVWAQVSGAHYRGATVAGEGSYDWKSKRIAATVRGSKIQISQLLARFPEVAKSTHGTPTGELSAYALISGPIDKLDADFRIAGKGSYREENLPRAVEVDRLLARGRYHDGRIEVDRLRARTPAGSISALGEIDVTHRSLAISVDGRGLDIANFTDSATGLASVSGQLGGTFDKPRFKGQAEGYDLTYQGTDIALVTGLIEVDPSKFEATTLDLVVGSSQVSGKLAIALPSHALSGMFASNALQLGDLLGDSYAGLVSVQTSELSGTVEEPQLTATLSGKDLLAQDLEVASLDGHAALSGKKLTIDRLNAKVANGSVDATGSYDLDAKTGILAARGTNLDVGGLTPLLPSGNKTVLAGLVSGTADLHFGDGGLTKVDAQGTLVASKVNGTDLGDGVWNASGDSHRISGSVQASFGTRFLALENAKFDLDAKTLDSDVVASNLTLQNLYQATAPYLSELNDTTAQKLAYLDGDVRVKGHVSGKWANPDLAITAFETDKLSYNGVTFGTLTASVKRSAGVWDIGDLRLADGAALASIHGTIDEKGQTKLDGDLSNFDVSKLADAFPGIPRLGGGVSGSFLASGASESPLIRASFNAESVAVDGRRIDFGLDLDTITIDGKSIEATGAVTMQGFHGQLKAHVPFQYPFTVPDGEQITATLKLNQRPLSDLAPYAASLDPKRVNGAINGALALTGTKDSLHVSGGISASAAELGFRTLDPNSKPNAPKYIPLATEFRDALLSLGVQDSAVTADISAKSSAGGGIDGQLGTKLVALDDLLAGRGVDDIDTWLESTLSGKFALTGVGAKEASRLVTGAAALNGALTLGGTLNSPEIDGSLDLTNLSMNIPSLGSEAGASTPSAINPRFNINVKLTKPGHIATSLASIDLNGHGHIGGSLSEPDASATLSVVKGDLRLPGGQVHLEPGGFVRPSYQNDATGSAVAHVMVDLTGTGHVTAVRNGDIAERYDVHLDVLGDLLVPDQVNFIATSDPPDLSQDQILALLGRTDLLNALGSGANGQNERNIQTAAIGYALPSLIDPLTTRLAAGLGLDYISIEYNALDQTSLLTAKTFGHGFSIQARRQISESTLGIPLSYDYRLVYQLPLRSRIVRRFSFFVGRDELTQWKIGFQYGQRF